jgi:RNA polymerase sigma-B factor
MPAGGSDARVAEHVAMRFSGRGRQVAQALGRAPAPTELAEHLDVETVREGLLAGNCYETTSLDRPLSDGTA